jgi:hypothetical protein
MLRPNNDKERARKGETPMFDFTKMFQAIPENASIVVLVVLGMVTFLGKLGVKGIAQLVSSMLLGILFGAGFMIAVLGVPTVFAGWFSLLIYGLMLGLVASGIYETGKEITAKVTARILGLSEEKGKG